MPVDGARHQIDLITAEAHRRTALMSIIVDFVHVLEYMWAAAWSFHPSGDPAAEDWGAVQALAILAGTSARVAQSIAARAAHLPAHQRGGADRCVRYLRGHEEYLRYDHALTAGWPIATGVIEVACRHLIADRLDITGARWAWPAQKPSSNSTPYTATATSTPTGATTSPVNTNTSTDPTAQATTP